MIERLGKFSKILQSGIHFIIPFVDQPRKVIWTFVKEQAHTKRIYRYSEYIERIDLRESVYDFPKQNVITKDNVTIEINALLYYQITDPKRAVYEVSNLPQAIEKLTQTTLRNIIGALDLDETLVSRDQINEKLRLILDDATDKWGVKVNRVELQEINPPVDIRTAMEKQMRAERDRRALILEAEGKKKAAILKAEGVKMAKITEAQGEAEARLVTAQAEAEAIQKIQKAVPSADPLPYLIALNYIKALPEITKDKEGKLMLIPYEAAGVMGSLATIKELFKQN
jgi:regulator of protease activity HflC (stomatin/prohibitin superfamily)